MEFRNGDARKNLLDPDSQAGITALVIARLSKKAEAIHIIKRLLRRKLLAMTYDTFTTQQSDHVAAIAAKTHRHPVHTLRVSRYSL